MLFRSKMYVQLMKDIDKLKDEIGLTGLTLPELKRDELCAKLPGDEFKTIYKSCPNMNAGPLMYKVAAHEKCGIASLKLERTERCGVEKYKLNHSCGTCGQAGIGGGCKKCESSKFGVESYKECPVEPQQVLAYNVCATPENGIETYNSSRDASCGVEQYASCVLIYSGTGLGAPIRPEDYYISQM